MKLPKYKYILAIADFSLFIISFLIAEILYHTVKGLYPFHFWQQPSISMLVYIICSFIFVFIWEFNNLYKLNVFRSISNQIASILKALVNSMLLLIVISFLFKLPILHYSRIFLLFYCIVLIILILIVRVGLLRVFYVKYASSWKNKKMLIIGAGKAGLMVAAKLLIEERVGLKIVGFLDDFIEMDTKITNHLKVIGKIGDLEKICKSKRINETIIAIDNISYERILEIIDNCRRANMRVALVSELFEIIPKKVVVDNYFEIPLIDVSERVSKGATLRVKYILDRFLASAGMIFLSPIFIFIGLYIRMTSKGPVLFKQIRIGKDGVPFLFYKFRSMEMVDGEDEERKKQMIGFMKNGNGNTKSTTKIINQSRVTKIGSFLRRTSLDELPQLINVIKGDMSLVGPRPCLPYEYENYDEWQKKRLSVTPGCTGLWQVSGRSEVSFKDSVVLDIYYLNNMSPWLDLQIIFKTIPVMLFSKGGK